MSVSAKEKDNQVEKKKEEKDWKMKMTNEKGSSNEKWMKKKGGVKRNRSMAEENREKGIREEKRNIKICLNVSTKIKDELQKQTRRRKRCRKDLKP